LYIHSHTLTFVYTLTYTHSLTHTNTEEIAALVGLAELLEGAKYVLCTHVSYIYTYTCAHVTTLHYTTHTQHNTHTYITLNHTTHTQHNTHTTQHTHIYNTKPHYTHTTQHTHTYNTTHTLHNTLIHTGTPSSGRRVSSVPLPAASRVSTNLHSKSKNTFMELV
jgi:hypothetical protein